MAYLLFFLSCWSSSYRLPLGPKVTRSCSNKGLRKKWMHHTYKTTSCNIRILGCGLNLLSACISLRLFTCSILKLNLKKKKKERKRRLICNQGLDYNCLSPLPWDSQNPLHFSLKLNFQMQDLLCFFIEQVSKEENGFIPPCSPEQLDLPRHD